MVRRSLHKSVLIKEDNDMTKTTRATLTTALEKMLCNHMQEGGDLETFGALAISYIEEHSDLDYQDDAQFDTALHILDDVFRNKSEVVK